MRAVIAACGLVALGVMGFVGQSLRAPAEEIAGVEPPPSLGDGLGTPVPGALSPSWISALEGSTLGAAHEVVITWGAIPGAAEYELARDGVSLGRFAVTGDPVADTLWRDHPERSGGESTRSVSYTVRTWAEDGGAGLWSAPAVVELTAPGATFEVEDYGGSDTDAAQSAIDDAVRAGGGLVRFGPRSYELDRPLVIRGDQVVLAGSGVDRTVLHQTFVGGAETCGAVDALVRFSGSLVELPSRVTSAIVPGSSTAMIEGAEDLSPGDIVVFDASNRQLPPSEFAAESVSQDPGAGVDHRYRYDINEVTAIDGDTVTFDDPFSQPIPAGTPLERLEKGRGNGIEQLTLRGPAFEATSYDRMLELADQAHFRLVDVATEWANRNSVHATGYDISFIGLRVGEVGPVGASLEACKYKVSLVAAVGVTIVDSTFGSADSPNLSFVTLQFSQRTSVRNSWFGRTATYGVNEHGGGSRDLVVENNHFQVGREGRAAVLLGNDTWGFGGAITIRGNLFEDVNRAIEMIEHPYDAVVSGNIFRGCASACLIWDGWGGTHDGYTPIADPDHWGSARLAVVDNEFATVGLAIDLGSNPSRLFPYTGVRDVVLLRNLMEAGPDAVRVAGGAEVTGRIHVDGSSASGGVDAATGVIDGTEGTPGFDPPEWFDEERVRGTP